MGKRSAGLLLYRRNESKLEVLLVHPGGPYWKRKDLSAWSIPKGECQEGENPLAAAQREFAEEVGVTAQGPFTALGEVRQPGGKVVAAWAVSGECDVSKVRSNTFKMEWPPGSARTQEFPEIDRAEWFSMPSARQKILKGQLGFLDRLEAALNG
jgi:predicted NUDIX family NTP pyrophosphohydrolase